jgi:hypothetical protein
MICHDSDAQPQIATTTRCLKSCRIFESTRLIGLVFLSAGCCTDFDSWLHLGLILRGAFGLIGGNLLLGILDHNGIGYLVTLIGDQTSAGSVPSMPTRLAR